MFKRLMYNKVITVLNLNTQKIPVAGGKEASLTFEGGYLLGLYPGGLTYAVKQLDTTTKYSYAQVEVVPVSEELSQETPSINKSDRSDYTFRYQVMFRSDNATIVEDALVEFRDYFFTNKQFTLDGYTVAVKTTRGDKLPQVGMNDGQFYNYYAFTVYATAIKNGYIKKTTDVFEIASADGFDVAVASTALVVGKPFEITILGTTDWNDVFGTDAVTYEIGDSGIVVSAETGTGFAKEIYEQPTIIDDIMTTQGNPNFSNATGIGKADLTQTTLNNRINIVYNDSYIENQLYARCMNKLDKDTAFNINSTFNGTDYNYTKCVIVNASRTLVDNGTVIMTIDWAEQDE